MAAGINYNNVWAARGIPIDVIATRQTRRPTRGLPHRRQRRLRASSTRSARTSTTSKVGDEVIIHPGWWERDDPWVKAGKDPMIAPSRARSGATTTELRLLRAVRRRPGAPGAAEGRPPDLGGGRGADARRHDRVPDALRLAGQHRAGGRRRARLGRLRRARHAGDPAREARRRRSRSPSSRAPRRASTACRSAPPATSTAPSSTTGASRRTGRTPPARRSGSGGARAFGKARSGRSSASAATRAIVFEHPGEDTVPTIDLRLRRRAAWS